MKAGPLRICVFSRAFHPAVGGLERIAELVARHAARQGHRVSVVTDTPARSAEDDAGFGFEIVRTRDTGGRLRAFRAADVVLSMNVSLHSVPLLLLLGKPVVVSHQINYEGQGWRARLLEAVKRQLTRCVPNVSCSAYTASLLPGRSVVVPNPYDDPLFALAPATQRSGDFVFCGRLVSDKGADLLIRAFRQVLDGVPDARLAIIGDGPERAALQALAGSLGVAGQTDFDGVLRGQALVARLREHACMVVPSLWQEPFGIVALEGLACCDTVIATRRGGLPEALGPCGIVVPAEQAALAAAMLQVARARRAGLALPGAPSDETRRAHLAEHRAERVAQRYLDLLLQAAG